MGLKWPTYYISINQYYNTYKYIVSIDLIGTHTYNPLNKCVLETQPIDGLAFISLLHHPIDIFLRNRVQNLIEWVVTNDFPVI